jgi:signal transduction histidine kinase
LVWADPVAIERVMENLISNAIVHRDPSRPISIEIEWTVNGRQAAVAVRDDGPGIDIEDRDRIFELFYRGRGAESDGSGLGLAIVKRIMDASSGSITFEPNPAGGSIFRLSWPAHPAAVPPAT